MRCQSAGLGDGRPPRHALEPSHHRKCQLRFAPARIGKSYDLCGHGSRIGEVSFELVAAIFTARSDLEELYCFQIS